MIITLFAISCIIFEAERQWWNLDYSTSPIILFTAMMLQENKAVCLPDRYDNLIKQAGIYFVFFVCFFHFPSAVPPANRS
jgi:hypothetical protein